MMEKQPRFVLKVSLEEMALRRVVVHFWNHIDILNLIDEFEFKEHSGFDFLYVWQERVEMVVKNKISKLMFPQSLKRRLNLIVRPVGLQIVQWKKFMEQYIGDSGANLSVLKQLCWTSAGALAYKETAQNLVRLKTIDIVDRFKIACTYCLADSLPAIWEELPEECKWHFCDNLLDTADKETLIEFYWAYILKGEDTKLLERVPYFYLNSFEFSARRGNKAATEFFLQKFSDEFRDSAMFLSYLRATIYRSPTPSSDWESWWDFPQEEHSDVVFYLLSLLPPEKQILVVADLSDYIFRRLLHWPWHDLFLENADLMWEFLSERSKYKNVLHQIRTQIIYPGYYIPKLIQECFRRSPGDFRKHFVNQECLCETLFSKFLNVDDTKTLRVIFGSIDCEDRLRLLSSYGVFRHLNIVLMTQDRQLEELFIGEVTDSKEERDRLEKVFIGFLGDNDSPVVLFIKREWQRLFETIDETDSSVPKRKSEDEAPTKAKKLCTEDEKIVYPRN